MKIAFVGGGSYSWGPELLGDLALSTALEGTVVLVDRDPVAGERMERLGRRYMQARDGAFEVVFSGDLAPALDGADAVILSITTGGLDAMRGDIAIPQTYGIYQAVGDTVGPGGIARGLRNIPVVVDLVRQMERYCPNATFINVTNPMTTLCRAAGKVSSIRTIGLCHEMRGVQRHMAAALGSAEGLQDWRVAGINHLPWLVGLDSADAAGLKARLAPVLPTPDPAGSPFQDNFRVKMDLLDLYGAFPAAGDRHVAEFFPSYLRSPAEAFDSYGVLLTSIEQRRANRGRDIDAVAHRAEGYEPVEIAFSGEQAVPLIEAMQGVRSDAFEAITPTGEFVVNIPNRGKIGELPVDVVVECMATVDRDGVHPTPNPPLPTGVLGLLQPHVAAQELVVDAALERRFDLALQALRLDPLSYRLSGAEARSLLRALDAHNAQFGPALLAS